MIFRYRNLARFIGASAIVGVSECLLVLADSVIAGRVLGETALGAMALMMPVFSVVGFCVLLLAVGTAIVCSEAFGRLDRERATHLAGQGLVAVCLLSLFLFGSLSLWLKPYFAFLTTDAATLDLACSYGRWYPLVAGLWGLQVFLLCLEYTYGNERECVFSFVIQSLVNVALSYALCGGLCGLPALGMAGISLGTVLACLVGLAIILPSIMLRRSGLIFAPRWMPTDFLRSLRIVLGDVGAWLFHAVLFLIVIRHILAQYGVEALPVVTIVFCLVRLTAFFSGIGGALRRPLSTVYQTDGNALAVRRLARFAIFAAFLEGVLLAGLVFIAPELVVTIAGIGDPELVAPANHAVRLTVVVLLGYSIANLINSYSRQVRSPRHSVILSVVAFLGVPTSLALAFGALFDMMGVYLAVAAGPLVSLAAFLPIFHRQTDPTDVRSWSVTLGDRMACTDVVADVGRVLSNVVEPGAVRRLTDVILLAFKRMAETNAKSGRRIAVEVSIVFGDESVQLIVCDDGRRAALDDLGLPVVHQPAAGFNRNIFTQPLAKKRGRLLKVNRADGPYVVLHGRDASPADIEAIIALDRGTFEAQYQVSPEQDRDLFLANRENGLIVKARATGEVIGYSMILPIHEDIYQKIRAGQFVDTALTKDMVAAFDHPGDDYRIYFASVVIHPRHRGASLLLTMVDVMVEDFIALAERGIYGRTLTADVVSREGEKLAQLLGLTEVCQTNHGSRIFEAIALPPELRETTPSTERLIGMYWERFVKSRLEG